MDFLNVLIDGYNIPILSAFLLGVVTSISPCPLATNITAIAYISREIKSVKNTLLNGLVYTLGRGIAYTLLALLIYFGFSSFKIAQIFQGWGDKVLGVLLILIGLVMFDVIKINFGRGNSQVEKMKLWLSEKGYIGSLLLGALFSLAFCPYSGVLFFGVFVPLILQSPTGILLTPIFAVGTGLPVILFSIFLAFSVGGFGKIFNVVQKIEKVIRYVIASVFVLSGLYYLQFLIEYLSNL